MTQTRDAALSTAEASTGGDTSDITIVPDAPSTTRLGRSVTPKASATVVELADRPTMLVEIGTGDSIAPVLSPEESQILETAIQTATRQRMPIVILMSTSGPSPADGVAAIDGWARAARAMVAASGVIPIIFGACGPIVSGPALLMGIADITIFTQDAYAFVSGPHMVRSFTGVPTTSEDLGGAGSHARSSGVASLVVDNRDEVVETAELLLGYLPSSVDDTPPRVETDDPIDRDAERSTTVLPSHPTGSYDVREIIADVADDGEFVELRAAWAPNLITALTSVGGHVVGVVANQTQALAGSIDIPASQKGARFVAFCDAFNIPLLTLVDTSGFLPGKDLEWRGMIRHGAQLAFAYARATVPRVALILRKSYGGAYIVMDSRNMGNDLMLAWPSAEVAVMGAKGAVEILHRGASSDERVQLEADYEARYLTPYPTAERGSISDVIDPVDTRRQLAAAFELLSTKRERLRPRRHGNTPL